MSELSIVVAPSFGDIALELYPNLSLPDALVVGEHYIYLDRCDVGARPVSLDVEFVAHTSCPAIVVVLDGSGKKVRILRDDLYAYPSVHNMDQRIMTLQSGNLLLVDSISDLAEMCKRAGAAMSTVICSSARVVIYYKDPLTNGVQEADFVDELHIRHPGNACLLIAVFPVDNL